MTNPSSVRRNLFHGNLSRRPASAGPPNGVVPNTSVSNRPSRLKPTSSDSGPQIRALKAENKDIVVRDKSGGYKLEVPILPPALVGEDGEELEQEENADPPALTGPEKEKFEQDLLEMMIRHRNGHPDVEPEEILHAMHDSLREKAASLDEDNWMFEPERDSFAN
ncbi:unnamed protein product [Penicillium salamii]|nr:unnamed protein product [Penicillium salamii]